MSRYGSISDLSWNGRNGRELHDDSVSFARKPAEDALLVANLLDPKPYEVLPGDVATLGEVSVAREEEVVQKLLQMK